MKLKKAIAAFTAFAMVFGVSGNLFNESCINILDVFASEDSEDYNAEVNIEAVEKDVLFGETVEFDISLDQCRNIDKMIITLSYDERLSFDDTYMHQGEFSSVEIDEEAHTITLTMENEKFFSDGALVRIKFKAPENKDEMLNEWDRIECYLSFQNIDVLSSVSSSGGISNNSSAYVSAGEYKPYEYNNIKYFIYKDHAEIFYLTAQDNSVDIEIPATVDNVPVTKFSDEFFNSINIKNIFAADDNEYFSSDNGVIYNKDFTELIFYPAGRTDTSYSVLDTCKKIRKNTLYLFDYDKNISLESLTIPESVTEIEDGAFCVPKLITICGAAGSAAERCANKNYMNFYDLETGTLKQASASGECGDNLTWNIDSEGTMTISGKGDMIKFPEQMNCSETPWINCRKYVKKLIVEDGVTSISNDAFAWFENLEEAVIADTVNFMDYQAFYACKNLKKINMPESLREIGEYCFCGCSLSSVTLPKSLMYIRDFAFSNGYMDDDLFGENTFTEIYIPENVREISSCAFAICKKLEKVTVSEKNNNFYVYENVLYDEDSNIIFIPYCIETLNAAENMSCFNYSNGYVDSCNLKTINFNSSIWEIDSYDLSHYWNTLEKINIPSDNSIFSSQDGVLYNKEKTKLLCYPAGRKGSVLVLPETVNEIDDDAIGYDTSLKDIYCSVSEEEFIANEYLKGRFTFHYNEEYIGLKGDIDGDAEITSTDALNILQLVVGTADLTDEQKKLADLDDDGVITSADALCVLQMVVGLR